MVVLIFPSFLYGGCYPKYAVFDLVGQNRRARRFGWLEERGEDEVDFFYLLGFGFSCLFHLYPLS